MNRDSAKLPGKYRTMRNLVYIAANRCLTTEKKKNEKEKEVKSKFKKSSRSITIAATKTIRTWFDRYVIEAHLAKNYADNWTKFHGPIARGEEKKRGNGKGKKKKKKKGSASK